MSNIKKIIIPKNKRHNAFLLNKKDKIYLGYRRQISGDSLYSVLRKEMLLGELLSFEEQEGVLVFFILKISHRNWQDEVFSDIEELNINFFWPPLDENDREAICPTSFWNQSTIDPSKLDNEEEHFRQYSLLILKELGFENCHIYDPACSTGRFLSSLYKNFPNYRFSASDQSPEMVSLAQNYLPEVFVRDIIKDEISDRYDIIFCRFVNHEVVTTAAAPYILKKLLSILNSQGFLIIFGHTPIACDVIKFSKGEDVAVKSCVGQLCEIDGVFQYYILQKM